MRWKVHRSRGIAYALKARENLAGFKITCRIWESTAISGARRGTADIATKIPVEGCIAKTKAAEDYLPIEYAKPTHVADPSF